MPGYDSAMLFIRSRVEDNTAWALLGLIGLAATMLFLRRKR